MTGKSVALVVLPLLSQNAVVRLDAMSFQAKGQNPAILDLVGDSYLCREYKGATTLSIVACVYAHVDTAMVRLGSLLVGFVVYQYTHLNLWRLLRFRKMEDVNVRLKSS